MSFREEPPTSSSPGKPRGVIAYDHPLDDPAGVTMPAAAPNDEFTSVGLDAKWTIVDGIACSPVDPHNRANCGASVGGLNAKYVDAAGPAGGNFLKTQVSGGLGGNPNGPGIVRLRQTYTLPIGRSIVIKFYDQPNFTSINNDDDKFFALTDNPTDHIFVGDYITMGIETEQLFPEGMLLRFRTSGVGGFGSNWNVYNTHAWSDGYYLQVMRLGALTYSLRAGFNPRALCPMGSVITMTNPLTHLWYVDNSATNVCGANPYPVDMIEWIREADLSHIPVF